MTFFPQFKFGNVLYSEGESVCLYRRRITASIFVLRRPMAWKVIKNRPISSPESKDTVNGGPEDQITLLHAANESNIKVYKKRWYILAMFFLLCIGQGVLYNTWSPIQSTARAVYKWDSFMIDLMPALGCVGPCLTIIPLGWLMDVKGIYILNCCVHGKKL